MDDYMDKTTAVNLLDNLIGMVEDTQENDYDTALKMGIEALKEHTQSVQRWIPCSERLPDGYGKTLVTRGSGVWALVMIAVYSNHMGISKPCFWIGNVGKNDFEDITDRVTAWMPLPKSYRG